MNRQRPESSGADRRPIRAGVLYAAGLAIALAAAWTLRHVILLVLAGILLGIALDTATRGLRSIVSVPRPLALIAVLIALAAAGVTLVLAAGPSINSQLRDLGTVVDEQIRRLDESLPASEGKRQDPGASVTELLKLAPNPLTSATAVIGGVLGIASSFVIVIVVGIYIAATPDTYLSLLRGFGTGRIPHVDRRLEHIGNVLRRWLLAQVVAMLVVGVTVYAGLLLIGMPLALVLAVISGLAEFIPYIGPIVGGGAMLLVAASQGTELMLWVLGLYLVVQALESYVLTPLLQSRALELPPLVIIFVQLGLGTLFGLLGVLLATPLAGAVHAMFTVKQPPATARRDHDSN